MNSIEIRHLTKRYGDRVIYQDVNLSFASQGLYAILGDSGSGKSTLLDLIAGLDVDYTGEVLSLGSLLKERSEDERSNFRLEKIGYIRQSCDLLDLESALDNVLLPLEAHLSLSPRLAKRKALDLLAFVGLKEKAHQRANTLSGGERQRVALARALVNDPEILLCDEPTGALDPENADMIYAFLHELSKKKLVLVVSHDAGRTKKYADILFTLKDGTFFREDNPLAEETGKSLETLSNRAKHEEKHPPFRLWLRHSFHLLGAKKKRTFLSDAVLVFSLLSLGLSLFVSRDLSNSLNSAFSSLTGEGVVVMQKAETSENVFSRLISADEGSLKRMSLDHPDLVLDYGVSYLAPFESYFPDSNEAIIDAEGTSFTVPYLGIRAVNDYLWLDRYPNKDYYPACPTVLEEEQIVLGLPYSSMASLCFSLHILRSYESLGQYLSVKSLDLLFELANQSWSYEDEQLLSVVAVTPDEVTTIYHYDHRWSSYLLQEKMRFPSSDEPDASLPWIMQKVFYLEPRSTPYEFMKAVREDPSLSPYVYERATYAYEQSHCSEGRMTELGRFYVYLADKHSLAPSLIAKVASDPAFDAYSVCAAGSYESFPEALASGFSNPFFLSSRLEAVEEASDALSDVPLQNSGFTPKLPDDAVMGYYLKPLSTSLSFSSDFSKLKSGVLPQGEEEIALSRHLYEKLAGPANVYLAGMVANEVVDERLKRDYRIAEVKVTGVVEEEKDVIYAEPYWMIDFWRDILGMSAFALEPDKVLLHLKEAEQSEAVIARLGAEYPSYRFIDPSLSVRTSVDDVVGYVELVLEIASVLTLAISGCLLLTVALLNALENKREGRMLFTLGIKREDIAESYASTTLVLTLSSALTAAFGLLLSEFFFDKAIRSNFQTNGVFILDTLPLLAVFLAAFIGLALSSFLCKDWIERRKFHSEGR